jgi:hypothetical protein
LEDSVGMHFPYTFLIGIMLVFLVLLIKLALTENMFYLKKLVPNFQSRDACLIIIAVATIYSNNNYRVGISDFG